MTRRARDIHFPGSAAHPPCHVGGIFQENPLFVSLDQFLEGQRGRGADGG